MGLKDCLATAVDGKELSQADADRIGREYDRATRRAALGSAATAEAEAKKAVLALLKAETEHQKRKAQLSISSIKRIATDLDTHRTVSGEADVAGAALFMLEHNGEGKFASVAGRQNEITGMAHAMMESLLYQFRRSAIGGDKIRMNRAQLPNVVRELFGESTGDAAAKGFAETWTQTAEWMRQRFNAAGGAIGKLEKWGLPQRHDARALRSAGLEKWTDYIRPLLDIDRMRHPLSGQPIHAAEINEVLADIWDNVVTDGWTNRDPTRQAFGKGALANQRAEHRFLVFKDAESWMTYQADFGGGGDPFATMMGHINMMAKDIAAMEVLGPNPGGTIEWLKQTVQKEAALKEAGKPARFSGKSTDAGDRGRRYLNRIDAVWGSIRGALNTPVSSFWGGVGSGVRSFITSSVLGGATLSSLSDIGTSQITRAFAGVGGNAFTEAIQALGPNTRREAVAAGLILDNAMHVFNKQARYVGTLGGPEWASFLGDRVLTFSGLTPWTQAGKHAFGLAFMHEAALQQGRRFKDLHPLFRAKFEQYGIGASDWDMIRGSVLHDMGGGTLIMRPAEIAKRNAHLAERFLGMIQSETEFAIPSGGHRSRTLLIDQNQPGTLPGEILRSFSQFKSFGAVYAMLHGGRLHQKLVAKDYGSAAAYAGSLLLSSMFLGGLSMHLKSIAAGRDPQPMTSPAFWGAAMMQGGGLGIYGDFLFADVNRYGGGLAGTIAGPTVERINDFRELTLGNLAQLASGQNTHFGRELVKFARGNIPGGNIWYLRLAWERTVLDQVQFLVDPEANAAFKRSAATWQKDFGQGFYWAPGSRQPQRGPDLRAAIGTPSR